MIPEFLKAVLFGVVEGITEWLPISSTGHLILLDEFVSLNVSKAFWDLFEVVIQLGAILAVVLLYFQKLNPFSRKKDAEQKRGTWLLWAKVVVAILPSVVVGLLLDDWFNAHFYNYVTVAAMLIVYGIAYVLIERKRQGNHVSLSDDVSGISFQAALTIGVFQALSIIPGTSRSGSTILGGMLIGISRTAAAEFSFFLAIPTMAGASVLKCAKFLLGGFTVTSQEWIILGVGCLTAFLVSLAAIRALTGYIRKHSFSVFGVYRIILGAAVLVYFLVK